MSTRLPEKVYHAIRKRDPEKVRAEMGSHIRKSLENTLTANRKARTTSWLS